MPKLDGTGPAGAGPMTGRGLGPCGAGQGFGRGRGMGYGRCFSWGSYRQPTVVEEKTMVQDDITALKEELKAAEARLAELENQK